MIGIIVFLYGVTIGSFLNVLIYRIPKKEEFVKSRSKCMSCGHLLSALDLIPLFSYLFLGGKCRYCKSKISSRYPIVEALNGLAYLAVYSIFGMNLMSVLMMIACSAVIVFVCIFIDKSGAKSL